MKVLHESVRLARMTALALLLGCGRSRPSETTETKPFGELEISARSGDARAQFELGTRLASGKGVPRDPNMALEWWRKAAEQGLPQAEYKYNMGVSYFSGEGTPKDEKEAVSWWLKAAKHGSPDSDCALGTAYSQGLGVPKDYREAIKWFRRGAEAGHALHRSRPVWPTRQARALNKI
jgi:TPR repeat protein